MNASTNICPECGFAVTNSLPINAEASQSTEKVDKKVEPVKQLLRGESAFFVPHDDNDAKPSARPQPVVQEARASVASVSEIMNSDEAPKKGFSSFSQWLQQAQTQAPDPNKPLTLKSEVSFCLALKIYCPFVCF